MYARYAAAAAEVNLMDAEWTRRLPAARRRAHRPRKPVWAFPSIGGSNPPLSVTTGPFARFSRISRAIEPSLSWCVDPPRWVNAGQREPLSAARRSLAVPSSRLSRPRGTAAARRCDMFGGESFMSASLVLRDGKHLGVLSEKRPNALL